MTEASNTNNDSRYTVGIDLGTSNSVLSYIDHQSDELDLVHDIQPIDQLIGPAQLGTAIQLPSFIYLPHEQEISSSDKTLPWDENSAFIVGTWAQALGSKTPMRLISSAKSWLCNDAIDPKTACLPVNSPAEVSKMSPLQASIHYLNHLKQIWDQAHPKYPLTKQSIVLTIPASFHPVARELTAQAAKAIGLTQLTLLEEPQAALYHWIQQQGANWREQLKVGDIVLVVDVGGGTTDFSLVAVTESNGDLNLERIAVGNHILLGGDNMDLTLAYVIQQKMAKAGHQLQNWQIQALTHSCRNAKEQLLSDPEASAIPIVIPSRGSKLLGNSLRSELTKEEVTAALMEGFFPQVEVNEKPQQQTRTALSTINLPYAQDAGITRHLAAFLCQQQQAAADLQLPNLADTSDFIMPTALLLNGGVFKASPFAQRLLQQLEHWQPVADAKAVRLLDGTDLDTAVARGASYYGYTRRGKGVRIRGGVACSYYIGIESAMPAVPGIAAPLQALCIAPFGMEEGTEVDITQHTWGLVIGEPVRFRFFGSTTRRQDQVGDLLDHWQEDEFETLPDISITLPLDTNHQAGDMVPVYLNTMVTTIGTLELNAQATNGEGQWQVSLEVRKQ